MSPRLRGRHRRADLPGMLTSLDEAVEALDGRGADPRLLDRARGVSARAGERLRLSGEHTVVALAGSTGSGKSSLFNVLSGADLSPVGVRRPTTSKAFASVWGSDGAAPHVQWVGVTRPQKHRRHRPQDAQQPPTAQPTAQARTAQPPPQPRHARQPRAAQPRQPRAAQPRHPR